MSDLFEHTKKKMSYLFEHTEKNKKDNWDIVE